MKKWILVPAFISVAFVSEASVVTAISQAPGFGGNIDLTAGSYMTWGYDADSLADGFTNYKSGTTVAVVSNPNSASTRDYGYTFTFNDGNSPGTGSAVASSGGLSGLLNVGPTIPFSGIVSSTEMRRLTLYVGGFHSAGSGKMDLTFDVTLTGGIADETGIPQTFVVNKDTSDAVGFVDGYAVATYTVEFTSATEPDLVVDVSYSNLSGTRNWGLSGYTVETVSGGTPSPGAPTGLAAVAGNGSVSLDWDDHTESNLTYSVYRSTNSGSYGSALATNLSLSSYMDSTASNGITYFYVVTAVDDSSNSNESMPSSEVSATPDASALPLLVWLEAGQGVALDAGTVVTWTNLASPGTYNAVQADAAKRPVVLTNESLLPGKPVLYFDGSDDLLTLEGTVSNALFEGELTIFFVGRRREGGVASGPEGILGNYQTGGYNRGWSLTALSSGAYGYRIGSEIDTIGWDGVGKFVIANLRYSDQGGDTGKMELFTSLTEEAISSTVTPFQQDSSTVDIGLGGHCGWTSLTFNKFLECDIAEIRIYGGALSDAERQSVWNELSAKYAIVTKKIFNVADFHPTGYAAPANTTIQITFDSSMDVESMTNMIVGQGGLDGYPEGGEWQRVNGQWTGTVSNSVFTFTPDQPFVPGALVMCEIPTNVLSVEGAVFNGTLRDSLESFVVDTGTTYPVSHTLLDPMAVVSNEYVDEFGVTNVVDHNLPMVMDIPDTGEPCPVMFWVHGGSFNGGNTGTLTDSAAFDAVMADYFSEKLGIAAIGVSWRSTKSEGTFTKAVSDINTAIQYVMDNAETLGIDTSRMGLYGGSAGTPMSSLISQLDTNIICYIGFNGSYNFLTGYGSGGGAFETDVPSFEENSAIFNIRSNDPPPTLLLHGTADTIIPAEQSTEYEAAIVAAGGEAEALLYRDEIHAFYNEGRKMHYPTLVACSEFLSRAFGLGIYLEGYDLWAHGYGIGAGTNDFDFDGLKNLYEYGVGGNPTNALDRGTLPIFTRSGSVLLYRHPRRSDDPALIYTLETTTNLVAGTWTSEGYTVSGTNVTGGTFNFVTNEVDTAASEKFIRLKIEQ
jgi:acetyl esterase/lipase